MSKGSSVYGRRDTVCGSKFVQASGAPLGSWGSQRYQLATSVQVNIMQLQPASLLLKLAAGMAKYRPLARQVDIIII